MVHNALAHTNFNVVDKRQSAQQLSHHQFRVTTPFARACQPTSPAQTKHKNKPATPSQQQEGAEKKEHCQHFNILVLNLNFRLFAHTAQREQPVNQSLIAVLIVCT